MHNQKKYTPVSCALYDELELYSSRQKSLHLVLFSGEELEVLIHDVKTVNNLGEFLITADGREIRLDEISQCNGKSFNEIC